MRRADPEERRAEAAALRRMIAGAAGMVALHRAVLDAINVYPVPDGDTGSNLGRTLSGAAAAASEAEDGDLIERAIDAALLSARGSSGVIGSQWLRGFLDAIAEHGATAPGLRAALSAGADAARAAVAQPRDGTMISVAADAAAGCGEGDSAEAVLAAAAAAAAAGVERTPQRNPVLADAGVVDAGARGLELMLQGMLAGLRGEDLPDIPADFGEIDPDWLAGRLDDAGTDGFCTELVVAGAGEAALAEPMRALASRGGETLMLASEQRGVRVHVHSREPEAAWAVADELGEVRSFHAVDMAAQSAAAHAGDGDAGIVAVVQGAGFARMFRELGASALLGGGAGDNASVAMIRSAAESTGRADVIVLPNQTDVSAAARSAADGSSEPRLHVVSTANQAEGVAAMAAYAGGLPVEDAVAEMEVGRDGTATGSVTLAARASAGPLPLREGQPFAMLDGEVAAAGDSIRGAVLALLGKMLPAHPHAALVTLYQGAAVDDADADEVMDAVCAATDLEVELVAGGQPLYHWLVALE